MAGRNFANRTARGSRSIDMSAKTPHPGRPLALLASGLIAADTVFLLVTLGLVGAFTHFHGMEIRRLLSETPLPLMIYALWLLGVAATAAAVSAIFLFDFRERWFWRWMLVGSLAWLAFPPVHALIGLGALLLLLRNRASFPKHAG
jgi:hypothetical protein